MTTSVLDALGSLTDEEVAALPPAAQARLAETLRVHLALEGPAEFATALSAGLWQPYRHLVALSNRIVAMIEHDECEMLLVDLPVRHGKSLLCSRWTPAWFLCKYPTRRVLLASYEADFAATHGRWVRETLIEHGGRFGVEIDQTSRAANRWDLGNGSGGMSTAGAGGPLTGKGGNLMILDDPLKNAEEANSPVMRQHLDEWWRSVFLTRREPGAKVILVASRWHQDDLMGRILQDTEHRVWRP